VRVRSLKIQCWVSDHAITVAAGSTLVLVLLGIVLIVAVGRLDDVPDWWTRADSFDAKSSVTIERAEELENAITTQLTMVRDVDDPRWSVGINPEQANAWLGARLRETIVTHRGADAWPSEIERVRIGIENDQLIVGARTASASGSVIVWAKLALRIDEQGDLVVKVYSAHAGTTRLPVRTMGFIGSSHRKDSVFRVGSGQLELGDGRVAQLMAMRVHEGRLEVVMETRVQD